MILVIDYGMGNLRSVQKAFGRIGTQVGISSDTEEISKADKLILPGVGHFKQGMDNLRQSGLIPILKKRIIEDQTPVLGICLGMQLLALYSEEGGCEGLGFMDAKVVHFRNLGINNSLKIPHIGWNSFHIAQQTGLLSGIDGEMVYFVHSYAVICNKPEQVICQTTYGVTFHSGFHSGNIYGLQFHPEKSHKAGLKILSNFLNL